MSENKNTTELIVLGIIPARGGSKSIPKKNVYPLAGKPLILWTIEAAQRSELLGRIVVSTDDEEIAEVSRGAGVEVINRPAELATDTAHTEPVLLHVLEYLRETEGYVPDVVALLQCTCPLRGADVIDAGIRKLIATGCDVVMTVAPLQHWFLAGQIGEGDRFQPEYDYQRRKFTQELPEKYSENGALFVTRTQILLEHQCRLGGDVRVLVMDPVHSIDIDTYEDLRLAEQVIEAFGIS